MKQQIQIDKNGYYGRYGGAFIPEMLYPNVAQLQKEYLSIIADAAFQKNTNIYSKTT
ncbi:hypothetical protein [Arachidicoccus ginsenosidivorans]|nr:hypothetical protein [Arachidicoccus ginsenosidivorans]